MVNITFEIENFDLVSVLGALAGKEGVTINIIQNEAPMAAEGQIKETGQQPVQEETPKRVIPDLTVLDRTEATIEAIRLRSEGYSWTEVGKALGISGKSVKRRIDTHNKRVEDAKKKAKKAAKKAAEEAKKPQFEGLSDQEIMLGVHSFISSNKVAGATFSANAFTTVLISSLKKKHRNDDKLNAFIANAHHQVRTSFSRLALAMGIGTASIHTAAKKKGGGMTSVLTIQNPDRIPSFEDCWDVLVRNGVV